MIENDENNVLLMKVPSPFVGNILWIVSQFKIILYIWIRASVQNQ